MAFVKVIPGQEVGQNGKIYRENEVLEVPDHLVKELAHKVLPSDEQGNVIEQPDENIDAQVASAAPHERLSILQGERDRLAQSLEKLDAQIATETQRAQQDGGAQPPGTPIAPGAPGSTETKPPQGPVVSGQGNVGPDATLPTKRVDLKTQ